jgi:hypothetical protein
LDEPEQRNVVGETVVGVALVNEHLLHLDLIAGVRLLLSVQVELADPDSQPTWLTSISASKKIEIMYY